MGSRKALKELLSQNPNHVQPPKIPKKEKISPEKEETRNKEAEEVPNDTNGLPEDFLISSLKKNRHGEKVKRKKSHRELEEERNQRFFQSQVLHEERQKKPKSPTNPDEVQKKPPQPKLCKKTSLQGKENKVRPNSLSQRREFHATSSKKKITKKLSVEEEDHLPPPKPLMDLEELLTGCKRSPPKEQDLTEDNESNIRFEKGSSPLLQDSLPVKPIDKEQERKKAIQWIQKTQQLAKIEEVAARTECPKNICENVLHRSNWNLDAALDILLNSGDLNSLDSTDDQHDSISPVQQPETQAQPPLVHLFRPSSPPKAIQPLPYQILQHGETLMQLQTAKYPVRQYFPATPIICPSVEYSNKPQGPEIPTSPVSCSSFGSTESDDDREYCFSEKEFHDDELVQYMMKQLLPEDCY